MDWFSKTPSMTGLVRSQMREMAQEDAKREATTRHPQIRRQRDSRLSMFGRTAPLMSPLGNAFYNEKLNTFYRTPGHEDIKARFDPTDLWPRDERNMRALNRALDEMERRDGYAPGP